MSVKFINKGVSETRNEREQRKLLQRQNTLQTHPVFHDVSKPSPLLSDTSEFPSLNETVRKPSNNSLSTGGTLKYSDKLKSQSSQKQTSLTKNLHFKTNAIVTNVYNQLDDGITRIKSQRFVNKNKDDNLDQNIPKELSNQSSKKCTHVNEEQRHNGNKKDSKKQKNLVSASTNFISISENASVSNVNFLSRPNNVPQSNKPIKSVAKNSQSKDKTDNMINDSTAKNKKKRKSKVKRQVALQSGKITVLTPEVHFKILNQTKAFTAHNFKSTLTDINDQDEYPELGKSMLQRSQKEIFSKKSNSSECQKETVDKSAVISAEENKVVTENVTKELPENFISVEKTVIEKKEKGDSKEKVHSSNPITVSFYDMLLDKNFKSKVNRMKYEVESSTPIGLSKNKIKKNICHPHNLLDSSPAIKRGKERENPKPKKPSQLKKIILLDRKARRKHLLEMKNSNEEENISNDNELAHKTHSDKDDEKSMEKTNLIDDSDNDPPSMSQLDEYYNQAVSAVTENTNLNVQDELFLEMEHLSLSEVTKNEHSSIDLSSIPNEDIKIKDSVENSNLILSFHKISDCEEDSHATSEIKTESATPREMRELQENVPRSPDALLNSLIGNVKSGILDKEKAAKILLHTRNFREYCNHLISKDIDDAVFALLDDLARFQDRLHQKDPIKARMKRRMIYGVKEVRKHIKLRKLKCIIIAVDIENVEAQGGLNDVLNDIKISAVDHQIPCVFALGRKVLGKVCRKPVPVSCVGVFNFEGSEANFKKMVELQTQSKGDYNEIFNNLVLKLTDEETASLLKARKEAPETLRVIRTNILNDFFLQSKTNVGEESTTVKITETVSDLIDCET